MNSITRRSFLAGGIVAAGAALGAAGRRFGLVPPDWKSVYGPGETLSYAAHRLFGRNALAREFPRDMISAKPFANSIARPTDEFKRHQSENFANWRLDVEGHVAKPVSHSIADLRAMEVRSQITEVSCEEGWSYVAEWTGTPLSNVLNASGVRPTARWLVYYSWEPDWWESIDIDEAMHPQTLVTWGMNGGDLPVPFGGPVRMRVPRQLGYKSVKFVNRLLVTDSLNGYVPAADPNSPNLGYSWYAGI